MVSSATNSLLLLTKVNEWQWTVKGPIHCCDLFRGAVKVSRFVDGKWRFSSKYSENLINNETYQCVILMSHSRPGAGLRGRGFRYSYIRTSSGRCMPVHIGIWYVFLMPHIEIRVRGEATHRKPICWSVVFSLRLFIGPRLNVVRGEAVLTPVLLVVPSLEKHSNSLLTTYFVALHRTSIWI